MLHSAIQEFFYGTFLSSFYSKSAMKVCGLNGLKHFLPVNLRDKSGVGIIVDYLKITRL